MTNWTVATTVAMVALAASRFQRFFVRSEWVSTAVTRKVAHVALGWLILFSWLLYDHQPNAKWIASLPPTILAAYFLSLAAGWIHDEGAVLAGSRSGSPREFALGPTFHVLTLAVITVTFWRTSPVGITASMFMICGDAAAGLTGTRVASPALPWNLRKSVAGSVSAMVCGSLGVAMALFVFVEFGHLPGPFARYLLPMSLVCLAGTLVESVAAGEIDNLTVPLACVAAGLVAF